MTVNGAAGSTLPPQTKGKTMTPNLPTGKTMSEGSDMPPSPDIEPAGNTDTVPLNALGMPDEKEQMTPPEVGDEVSYQVTGKVTAINGGLATIERMTINGQSVDDGDGDTGDTEEALQNDAKGMTI